MASLQAAREAQRAQQLQELQKRVAARGHTLVSKVPAAKKSPPADGCGRQAAQRQWGGGGLHLQVKVRHGQLPLQGRGAALHGGVQELRARRQRVLQHRKRTIVWDHPDDAPVRDGDACRGAVRG